MKSATPSLQVPRASEAQEPVTGNYFVSAYPPFSCWSRTGVDAFQRHLQQPPPGEDSCLAEIAPGSSARAGPAQATAPTAGFGLYVHIPFCAQRCTYCYYLSYDDRTTLQQPYVEALLREARMYAVAPALHGRLPEFVYIGGGTPSLLSGTSSRCLLDGLRRHFPWTAAREVTFECAPKTVTASKAAALRAAGVTRISLGVQQMDDRVLAENGRVHLAQDVYRAYGLIRDAGFTHVNLDLMVGLLGETDDAFHASLARVIDMAPESVTLYQLEIPHNTPLYRLLDLGGEDARPAPWSVKRRRLASGFARLEAAGYRVRSAYSAVKDPLRHRFHYQEDQYAGADVLGLGLSAFSFLGGIHQQNRCSLSGYVDALATGKLPLGRAHVLTPVERQLRRFLLQLKLGRASLPGSDAGAEDSSPEAALARHLAGPVARFQEKDWLGVDAGTVSLTREGLLRVDRMLPELYLPEHRHVRYS